MAKKRINKYSLARDSAYAKAREIDTNYAREEILREIVLEEFHFAKPAEKVATLLAPWATVCPYGMVSLTIYNSQWTLNAALNEIEVHWDGTEYLPVWLATHLAHLHTEVDRDGLAIG